MGRGFKFWGSEFRVYVCHHAELDGVPAQKRLGIRVQGLEFVIWCLGFRVWDLWFKVQGLGFWVCGLVLRI